MIINYLRNKLCLVDTVKELELEVHNQQQLINSLQEELDKCNTKLLDKYLELSNLNMYTGELEIKLNKIKAITNEN